jgi:hypothetical protein
MDDDSIPSASMSVMSLVTSHLELVSRRVSGIYILWILVHGFCFLSGLPLLLMEQSGEQ